MKKLLPISVIAIFAVAPTFADNITASSTCTNGVLGTYTGPANIEANFDPNTINTTWYSNGTAMTVDSAYQTCTYAAPLTPPTPAPRAGYEFNGWKIRPECKIPSSLVSNNGSSYAAKNFNDNNDGSVATYGINQPGEWGVSWENGDKVLGKALCSAHSGDNHNYTWSGTSSEWASDETTLTSASGEAKYCWCRVTDYMPSSDEQCSFSSPQWVLDYVDGSSRGCTNYCARYCAYRAQTLTVFRTPLFTGLVAQ